MPRSVLVTGGAGGIGLGVVKQFLEEGDDLTVIDVRLPSDGEFAELLRAHPDRLWAMAGDITRPQDRDAVVEGAVERFGRIDILVNNAGVAPRQRRDMMLVDEESWDFVFGVNLKACFFLTQRVVAQMLRQDPIDGMRGFVINFGSLNSYCVAPERVEYAASKAGVSMLTQVWAHRLAGDGILVHEVRPGVIDTPMTGVVHEKYTRMINETDTFPIARWGEPSDVARAISALVGPGFRYSTGEVINVDGGFHIRKL